MEAFRLVTVRGSKYIHVEGVDHHGNPYRESTGHSDPILALERAQVIHRDKTTEGVRPLALQDALAIFRRYKEVTCKVSAAELEHVDKVYRLMEFLGEEYNCNYFDLDTMEEYINVRRKLPIPSRSIVPKPPRFASDETISKELNKFFEMLRYLRSKRLYGRPLEHLMELRKAATRILKPSPKRTTVLNDEQFVRLWNSLPQVRRDYIMVWTLAGARFSEISRIEPKHIDHEERRLFLIGRKGDVRYRERWVPLHPSLYKVLVGRAEGCKRFLFDPWHDTNVRAMLKRHCEKLGIPVVTINDLRRTFITWHAKNGTSLLEMKAMAGHSPKSRMIEEVYAQTTSETGRAATEAFPDVLPPDVPEPSDDNVIRPSKFWPPKQQEALTAWQKLTADDLRALLDEHTQREIAQQFDVDPALVSKRVRGFGIVHHRKLTADEVLAAIRAHKGSRPAAAALGIPRATFRDAMRRHGITERGERKDAWRPRKQKVAEPTTKKPPATRKTPKR